jgi:hypothetical protein
MKATACSVCTRVEFRYIAAELLAACRLRSRPASGWRRSPLKCGHEPSSTFAGHQHLGQAGWVIDFTLIRALESVGIMIYRVEFVDYGDNVRDVERLERATDAEAIEGAHKMNIPTFIAGFDVWEEDRLIHRYRKYQQSPP